MADIAATPVADLSARMIRRNAVANIGLYAAQVVLLLWFTRFLLLRLGPATYGLIPLATATATYFGLIMLSLNSAVGRFLTRDLVREDPTEAQATFNSALFGSLGIAALLMPVAVAVAFLLPPLFNVPQGQGGAARLLFLAVLGSLLVVSAANAFSATAFARNRLDLLNVVQAAQVVVRVAVPAALIAWAGWALAAVSLGMALAGIAGVAGAVVLWRLLLPSLRVDRRAVRWPRLREMVSMGGWAFVVQSGTLLLENTDVYVVNLLWGSAAAGRYGSVLLFAFTLRALGGALASPILPPIVHRLNTGEDEWVIAASRRATRLLCVLMALPVGLVCGFAPSILTVWLGPDYRDIWPILVVLTAGLTISVAGIPAFYVLVAANRLRLPGVVTVASGVVSLGLAYLLGRPASGIGVIGIAVAFLLVASAKNILFGLPYAAHVLGARWWGLVRSLAPGLVCEAGVIAAGAALVWLGLASGWAGLAVSMAALTGVYAAVAGTLVLTREDRDWLRRSFARRSDVRQA
jgi:membrane protein EpsK